jgi:transcriptional regulator with XRE-family HTH domain
MTQSPRSRRARPRQFFRQWREYLGLTQERALDRLGWSQSKISRIESGDQVWNGTDLADLEMAYGKTGWELTNIDPTKEGEVVDLMSVFASIEEAKRGQAIRLLKAFADDKA